MKTLFPAIVAGAAVALALSTPATAVGVPTNRLSNVELSHLRGGLPPGSPRAHLFEIAGEGTIDDFQTIDGATWVAFDNWLATTGVQLIAANAYGLPPGIGR